MRTDALSDMWGALNQYVNELLATYPVLVTIVLGGIVMWLLTRRG